MTKPASRMQRWVVQPIAHSKTQSALITVVIVALGLMYWPALRGNPAETFWNWIDPVAGISAFVISMAILYNQARDRWENGLEKRLTAHYVNTKDDQEIACVENAYLAGESDIRQWTQSLGRQMFGHNLDLDMNWDDAPPRIVQESSHGKIQFFKSYSITLSFDFNAPLKEGLEEFSERGFKHSHVEGSVDHLPVRWIRQEEPTR